VNMRGHCEVGSGSSWGIPAGKGAISESDDRANGFYVIAIVVAYMGCLALALVAAQLPEAVPAELRAATATLVLYLLPGLALERLLRPAGNAPLAVRIPMGIMFSLCGLYLTSLLLFIAHPTASVSIWLEIALSALPILGLLLASIRRRHTFTWRAPRRSLKAWLVPAGVAFLVFALVLVAVPQRYTHGRGWDSVYNLTISRKVAALPQLSFTSAFVNNDFIDPAYGYNPHLLSVGMIARWSHTDPAHAWAVLSLLLLVFYLLSVYSLAWRFLRSHPGALFVMAFGIATFFVHFFTVRSHCTVYANPSCLVRPAVLMAAFFLLPLLEEWSRPNALSFALATATAASIHGSGGLFWPSTWVRLPAWRFSSCEGNDG